MLQLSSRYITASLTVSPEGTQDKTNRLPTAKLMQQPAAAAAPDSEPWGNSGYWPQIAGVHAKGMTSVGPDS